MKLLVKTVEGAHLLNFKVNSLGPIAAKASKLLKYCDAKKRYDRLALKLQEIQQEMDVALGLEDIESAVGVDCQP